MRHVLTVLLVATVIWLGLKFNRYAKERIRSKPATEESGQAPAPGKMRGMAAALEPAFEEAKRGGPENLWKWIEQHRADLRDPRLADIELDYVVLVGGSNPAEARRVLASLEPRVQAASPVHKRFQQLKQTYSVAGAKAP
ncbi:MAG TPA: hypothetical protein PKM73_17055 [Verrucomicrobiota bacterium]|nr:hypothetical protein [Verrucomicrobiota bacterium]HNU51632.1 hypothetical protein [Verrucomicrobiota bacterium]